MAQFSIDEVFEMACQIERNGRKYYLKASEQAPAGPQRNLLASLAEWEQRHERLFSEMRSEIPEEMRDHKYDPDEQGALYVRAMVEGRIFDADADPAERLTGEEPFEEMLATAISLEKNSILFYVGAKDLLPPEQQEQVDRIIREEMRHCAILANEATKERLS
jgi:rubrerythrin